MAFGSVLGHERIKGLLNRAIASKRIPQALLFAGPEGVGKRTLALAFARALLCERGGAFGPCEECTHCRRVLRAIAGLDERRAAAEKDYGKPDDAALFDFRLHPDVVLVEPPTRLRRAEILSAQAEDLVRETYKAPFEARARAFVIDDAHALCAGSMVTAANMILKSLEEPPSRAYFVLVTAQPQALLPTIRSRCQTLRFGPLPLTVVSEKLTQEGMPEQEARLRASLSGGSLGAAIELDSEAWRAERDALLSLLEEASRLDVTGRLRAAERLRDLDDARRALTTLRGLLRDVAALRAGAGADQLVNADLQARLEAVASGLLGERAAELGEAVAEARLALTGYANEAILFDELVGQLAGERVGG
jgi:DNA polymerase III subunit delta'